MKKMLVGVLALLCVAGCAPKKVMVQSGNSAYVFLDHNHKKDGTDPRHEWEGASDPFFTAPRYVAMFNEDKRAELEGTADGPGFFANRARIAGHGAGLLAGSTFGSFGMGVDAVGLVGSVLFGSEDAKMFRWNVNNYYTSTVDGSVTIAKWVPGGVPNQAAADAFTELKGLLTERCGDVVDPRRRSAMWGKWHAFVAGRCVTNPYPFGVLGSPSFRFKDVEDKMGEGVLVSLVFPAARWNEEQRKDLSRFLRENLSSDWYVMRAMPIQNAQTGAMEPMYLVSKAGKHRAFPLPPKPEFK